MTTTTLPYMPHATNNLKAVLADPKGAVCVHCMQRPCIHKETETVDESTVLCPICGIDAVVPASVVPTQAVLRGWHRVGFSVVN